MTEQPRYKKILSQTLSHSFIFFVFLLCLAAWALLMAYLMKFLPQAQLPGAFADPASFKLPVTAADLGSAMAIVQGLFSAIAIILGLFAIILQGRDLRLSAQAQREQAEALSKQIAHQDLSAKIAAKTAQLQCYSMMLEHHNNIRASYLDSIRDVERRIQNNEPSLSRKDKETKEQRQYLLKKLDSLKGRPDDEIVQFNNVEEMSVSCCRERIKHESKLIEYRKTIISSKKSADQILKKALLLIEEIK